MNEFDCIVVGSDSGCLSTALLLQIEGFKVLLLEQHNTLGDLSCGIKKGRFEFEPNIHNLFLKDNKEIYSLSNILDKSKLNNVVKYSKLSQLFRVITHDKDYTLPFGIDNYIKYLDDQIGDCESTLKIFFDLAKECREAMNYIYSNIDELNYEYIRENYNNFVKVSSYSLSKVLDFINMNKEVQDIVSAMWIYFGSSKSEISFVEYSIFLLNSVEYGLKVPTERSYGLVQDLANCFLENGGQIRLNSKVKKLLLDDKKVNGVCLDDGSFIYANNVYINDNLVNIYGKMINLEDIPREALRNINRREIGARLFTVHLGLNRSADELNLKNYNYLIYNSLNSDLEIEKMNKVNSGNLMACVLNNAVEDASVDGTCILSLSTLLFGDSYEELLEKGNNQNTIVNNLIEVFEKNLKVNIYDYIEELEIISPLDSAVISDCYKGSIYNFKIIGMDNILPRLLNRKREQYIEGLFLNDGFLGDSFGYNSVYFSSLEVLNHLNKCNKGDKNE